MMPLNLTREALHSRMLAAAPYVCLLGDETSTTTAFFVQKLSVVA